MSAHPGDRIVLHAGTYKTEQISGRTFTDFVFIETADGDKVTLPGITFTKSDHIAFRNVSFAGTVKLDGSSNFIFHAVTLDGGATEEAALQIHGQSAAGASHDVLVEDSKILGGGRTIFVLGAFAPSDKWNHHLTFVRNDITCGSHNCWQISGGRDMLIADNKINGTTTDGVLTAGGTRISILRNRFHGMGMKPPGGGAPRFARRRMGQLRRRREHDLERHRGRQQPVRRLGQLRAARRRARHCDRLQLGRRWRRGQASTIARRTIRAAR